MSHELMFQPTVCRLEHAVQAIHRRFTHPLNQRIHVAVF